MLVWGHPHGYATVQPHLAKPTWLCYSTATLGFSKFARTALVKRDTHTSVHLEHQVYVPARAGTDCDASPQHVKDETISEGCVLLMFQWGWWEFQLSTITQLWDPICMNVICLSL